MHVVVAIDGPSGAGKSSAARGVARRLGLRYLDTGAMYRALTLGYLRRGIDVRDAHAVAESVAEGTLAVGTDPDAPAITLDGADVGAAIRTAEVTAAVSAVSAVPAVRARLVRIQRAIIAGTYENGRGPKHQVNLGAHQQPGGIVVEGRDIGTTVAPDATVKIYLTASPEARAARRSAELDPATAAEVGTVHDLARRDHADSTRAASPLAVAPDAVEIDATDHTLDDVIDMIVAQVTAAAGAAGL